ncbi:MAG: cyclic nucleotide-binding domain-containing protein [Dokdonella sp.]
MSSTADAYVEIPSGKPVYSEGDSGKALYIIESGSIDLIVSARGKEPIASLGPGDFFGEMSLLDDQPRFATALVRKSARLLKVERDGFADVLRENIGIATHLLRSLAARHQQCETRLSSALTEARTPKSKPAAAAATMSAEVPAVAAPPAPPTRQAPVKPLKASLEPAQTSIERPAAPPLPTPKARGSCLLRHAKGQVFQLDPALSEFLVGRPDLASGINPELNLSDVDPTRSLSRRHAKLVREGQLFFVREENGTVNGTFVNNVRIETGVNVPIKPGDKLRFGAVELDFAAA